MARRGDVWAASSRDYDSLLFGAPRLVRYLTVQGQEWLPSKGRARKLEPEVIELDEVFYPQQNPLFVPQETDFIIIDLFHSLENTNGIQYNLSIAWIDYVYFQGRNVRMMLEIETSKRLIVKEFSNLHDLKIFMQDFFALPEVEDRRTGMSMLRHAGLEDALGGAHGVFDVIDQVMSFKRKAVEALLNDRINNAPVAVDHQQRRLQYGPGLLQESRSDSVPRLRRYEFRCVYPF